MSPTSNDPPTRDLDLLPTIDVLHLMNDAETRAVGAVRAVAPKVARAVDEIAGIVERGGRVHLFGAGTSGRLAVLDASECPPTFGVPADLFQGHIAGGTRALTEAIEGAEDDAGDGAAAVDRAGVRSHDAVVLVTASGSTPWCLGAARRARGIDAATYGITCRTGTPLHELVALTIDPAVGDEVVLGSTRLSAGSAQKHVLNMLSTGVMVRRGRTYGNLMTGVQPTNDKLRARARALVAAITKTSAGVDAALAAAGDDVSLACVMIVRKLDRASAAAVLAAAGSLRKAIAP